MSNLLRLFCRDASELPNIAYLRENADWGHHIVLKFPDSEAQQATNRKIIAVLSAGLPDHSVFDSGGSNITVFRVVSESDVVEHESAILRAAQCFRADATAIAKRLRKTIGGPLGLLNVWSNVASGEMGGWRYYFHGGDCTFTNRVTGQILEVDLCFGEEFGVLAPYFFVEYVQSTKAHRHLAPFLRDYHSSVRTLEIMERRGTLRRIHSGGEGGRSGLVAY